jgi:hydrogenase expression/formation protein HypC
MCLAVPAKVVSIEGSTALVEIDGNRRSADVSLIEDLAVGDYVILHAGFAIEKYDQAQAEETLRYLRELADAQGA